MEVHKQKSHALIRASEKQLWQDVYEKIPVCSGTHELGTLERGPHQLPRLGWHQYTRDEWNHEDWLPVFNWVSWNSRTIYIKVYEGHSVH